MVQTDHEWARNAVLTMLARVVRNMVLGRYL